MANPRSLIVSFSCAAACLTAKWLTRCSMVAASKALDLASLTVVHAGKDTFTLRRGVRAMAAARLVGDLKR